MLFAVIVLGIGFIMVAAVFPVALQQSKITNDETIGASVARGAVSTIGRIVNDNRPGAIPDTEVALPPTGASMTDLRGRVQPFRAAYGWDAIRGNLIFADDPRYAVVPLYARDGYDNDTTRASWASTAQLYLFVVQVRGQVRDDRVELVYDQQDYNQAVTGSPYLTANLNNLAPRPVQIRLVDGGAAGVDFIQVKRAADASNFPAAVDEGCYVVTGETARIYRVGLRRTDLDSGTHEAWELQPGSDMRDNTENEAADVGAWVVGRERRPDGTFDGLAQDISIYTTFIPVKP